MKISRRDFVYGAGGAAATTLLLPRSIAFADAYDTLRLRWCDIGWGSGYDPNIEPYDSVLTALGLEAVGYMQTIVDGLWPDLPIGRDTTKVNEGSGNITDMLSRIQTIAEAYYQPNTGLTGQSLALGAIMATMNTLTTMSGGYTATGNSYGNWWDWFIGAPSRIVNIVAMLYPQLAANRASYLATVDHFVRGSRTTDSGGSEAGNISRVLVLHGILAKNAARLEAGCALFPNALPYVTSGSGFYQDGSYIYHDRVPYAGTYGASTLGNVVALPALLAGSSFEIDDPALGNTFNWVEDSFAPFIYNGIFMDGVAGRAIASESKHDHQRARGVMCNILVLAESASPELKARFRQIVKGWFERDGWYPLATNPIDSIPDSVRVQALMSDASVVALPEPIECRSFPRMDRMVHRRSNWCFAVSMCSTRTCFYENNLGVNSQGWHTNSGMTYWWGHDFGRGQYSDCYWPTVDRTRLPGTTTSKKSLANSAGGTKPVPANTWAGGVTNGVFGVFGQDTRGLQSTLQAKKSWFCLSDMIVCLGAGIQSTDGVAVESTVDNRNLGSGGASQAFIVNGVSQSVSLTWSATLSATRWAHLANFGGYVFYDTGGATIKASRKRCTGRWSDIDPDGSTDLLERKFLTFWYDHGTNPTNGKYAYALMPGATSAQTQARSDGGASQLSVLENRKEVQAVSGQGVLGINFWSTGYTVQNISVDAPCSVMMAGPSSGENELCLADATQALTAPITLTLNRFVPLVTELPPEVTIVEYTFSRLRLRFDVAGKKGATLRVKIVL